MSKEGANTKVIGRIFRSVGGSVTATRVCTDNHHWDGGTYGKRQATMGIQWLDSPSTTSEITYQFAWASYNNSDEVESGSLTMQENKFIININISIH